MFFREIFSLLGKYSQQIQQESVNIKVISFSRFDNCHDYGTSVRAFLSIAEEETPASDNIRLDFSFDKIVGHFNFRMFDEEEKLIFLISSIDNSLAKSGSFGRLKGIYGLIYFFKQRFDLFLSYFKYPVAVNIFPRASRS